MKRSISIFALLFTLIAIFTAGCGNTPATVDVNATVEAQVQATLAVSGNKAAPVAAAPALSTQPPAQPAPTKIPPTATPVPPMATSTPIPPTPTPTATATPTMTPAPLPTSTEIPCREWKLTSDFQVWPKQENPNRDSCGNLDVWYFMGSDTLNRDPNTYSLLSDFVPDNYGIVGFLTFQGPEKGYPFVAFNATGITQKFDSVKNWLPNTILIHPASSGLVVIGWRSPINGNVKITGSVLDIEPGGDDGINWYIDNGATSLAGGSINDGGKQDIKDGLGGSNLSNVAVQRGEFVYFMVDPRGSYRRDSTVFDITISR